MTTIGDMTLEELLKLIDDAVDRRIKKLLGDFDFEIEDDEPEDTRTYEEVLASIERSRWTPPPGAKSSGELLQEDRDR